MKHYLIIIGLCVMCFYAMGQNQNVSSGNVFDGEPYIAIDPQNPQHLVVGWMGWVNLVNQFKIKIKTSFDGGKTWSAVAELPHTVVGYSSADPCLAFDDQGKVYCTYIDFTGTAPPVTGGVYLCQSSDGGLTWSNPTEVISSAFDGNQWPIDRPWMVIDRSSAATQGNIYVTSFNLNRNSPPYRPYLSISTDAGTTFSTRYVDTTGSLAGTINQLPVCSPAVAADGTFFGAYPSYVISQSLFAKVLLAYSEDGGRSMQHRSLATLTSTTPLTNYPDAKKAGLLICDPSDADHLAIVGVRTTHGELDVFFSESFDRGGQWTPELKINDDPVGNDRLQDMIWADFDEDGDLIVSWRDRRNGSDGSYQNPSEIYAAFRKKDAAQFSPNFSITSQSVAYDSVLTRAGNDFMCIKLRDDTLSAVWGDTRDGKLNIWFQRMGTDGTVLSNQLLSSTTKPLVTMYPNPSIDRLFLEAQGLEKIALYDLDGSSLFTQNNEPNSNTMVINMSKLRSGTYVLKVYVDGEVFTEKVSKVE